MTKVEEVAMTSVNALGYLGIGVSDIEAWRAYAINILGVEAVEHEGGLDLRYDEKASRIRLRPTGEDDVVCLGFEVDSMDNLRTLGAHLEGMGIAVRDGDADLCRSRQVDAIKCCNDPFGLEVELYVGAREGRGPFTPPRPHGGFITGDMGLGHIVLSAADEAAALKFYMDGLGFNLSDNIFLGPEGRQVRLTFMHCNPRHHTLAIAPVPAPKRLNHIMIQAASLDDVGSTLDIVQHANVPISSSMGKHTNDLMVSFYMQTPSGFDIEYGCDGLEIRGVWTPSVHHAPSLWGHRGRLNA